LRLYLNNKNFIRSKEDIYFELDFLEYLFSSNIPVVSPIKGKSNQNHHVLTLDGKTHTIALFPFAKGQPIEIELDNCQAQSLGKIFARMHDASSNYKSSYSRFKLNMENLIEEPLNFIEKYARSYGLCDLFFEKHKHTLKDALHQVPINEDTYGLIHGDPNPSNYHYCQEQGFTLYDFDHCGYGFRIHDLAVMKLCFPEGVFHSILSGYESVRPLQDMEKNRLDVYADILLIRKFLDIFNMLEITGKDNNEKRIVTLNAINTLKDLAVKYK
jgi:Ser/Thr protein kinase RdoA (MazF antagonist)